jgi:hypothetical protein
VDRTDEGIVMRLAIMVGLASVLAGCGGSALTGDAKAVHDICTANGGTASYCDCTTKELQAKLSPEVFAQVAKRQPGSDPETLLDVMAAADKACVKP